MTETSKISLRRYFLIYGLAFLIGYILSVILVLLTQLKAPWMTVVLTMLSAHIVVHFFIKHHKRAPDNSERRRLVWGSLLISFLFDIIPTLILFIPVIYDASFPESSDSSIHNQYFAIMNIAAILLILVWIIDYFMLHWIYGSNAKKQLIAYQKKHGIGDIFD